MSDFARAWMVQALSDLRDANILFDAGSYSGAIIFSEQCAEKISKGLLLYTGVDRFNHSVITLAGKMVTEGLIDASQQALLNDAKWITQQYTLMRYPNDAIGVAPCEMASRDDAERAISCAKTFVAMAEKVAPELLNTEVCALCHATPCVCPKVPGL